MHLMRRWHAVPLAALVALAVGAGLFGATTPNAAEAGVTADFTLAVDCDTSTAAVESVCNNVTPGAYSVNLVLTNNSGAASTVAAFAFGIVGDNTGTLSVTAVPDFNEANAAPATFDCTLIAPVQDSDPSATGTASSLDCFVAIGSPAASTPIANGQSIVFATVSYNAAAGGATFTLDRGTVGSEAGQNLIDCADPGQTDPFVSLCTGALVGFGQAAPVDTPTPTATATATATATNTSVPPTPCASNCPTSTSLAFVTVTPTPGTPTAAAGSETAVPTATQPGGTTPPGGQQPGGGTGPGGGRPITLPDTGAGDGGGFDWTATSLMALAAIAAGLMAGGVYYAAVRRIERNKGE